MKKNILGISQIALYIVLYPILSYLLTFVVVFITSFFYFLPQRTFDKVTDFFVGLSLVCIALIITKIFSLIYSKCGIVPFAYKIIRIYMILVLIIHLIVICYEGNNIVWGIIYELFFYSLYYRIVSGLLLSLVEE